MAVRERFSSTLDPTLNELGFSTAGRSPIAGTVFVVGDPELVLEVQADVLAQANNALASATASAASAAASAAALADFRTRFLGAFAAPPTLDNAGNSLQEGALYFDTITGFMYAYHGSGWSAAYAYGGSFPINVFTQSTASMTVSRAATEYHRVSLNSNVTSVTLSGWPAAGQFGRIQLEIRNMGSFSISGWPASVNWPNGIAPSITGGTGKKDVFVFWSTDGGTVIYGSIVGQNFTP